MAGNARFVITDQVGGARGGGISRWITSGLVPMVGRMSWPIFAFSAVHIIG
jgi:hypothetical protein